jgi:hypothetical protein
VPVDFILAVDAKVTCAPSAAAYELHTFIELL